MIMTGAPGSCLSLLGHSVGCFPPRPVVEAEDSEVPQCLNLAMCIRISVGSCQHPAAPTQNC